METFVEPYVPLSNPEGSSPFGGIPRNWKQLCRIRYFPVAFCVVPPSGGSLEIGNNRQSLPLVGRPPRSPFGGIPRNWKRCPKRPWQRLAPLRPVPPSGGSLEIGNIPEGGKKTSNIPVPPSGGSLEIGNVKSLDSDRANSKNAVPPSGGSLEIGNDNPQPLIDAETWKFPLRGDP